MLRNYLLIALRTLFKNKTSAVVNVVGLSVAIACAVVVFLFLERTYTLDHYHEDGERIFLVENVVDRSGRKQLFGDSPMPLGPAAVSEIAQIERAVRVEWGRGTFRVGDRVFSEWFWFADEGFLSLFSFPLRLGGEDALAGAYDIVLSEAAARRYFGNDDPIGRTVTVRLGDAPPEEYTVRAVADRFPGKSSFTFNALLPYDRVRDIGVDETNWAEYTAATFLKLRSADDLPTVAEALDRYLPVQNAANRDWPIAEFSYDNLYDISERSEAMSDDISSGTHPTAIVVLAVVALFLLALSCVNYMNLAVATASGRLKEIGVRKTLGGSRGQLVAQFLLENVVLCLLSLVLGVAIAYFVFIPGFNALFDFVGGRIALGEAGQGRLWAFLVGLMLVTGLASGAYPAFYIASFRPAAVLHGRESLSRTSMFTRSLLTLQFVLAFLTMTMGVILAQNAEYQANRDWGYDAARKLVVPAQGGDQIALLRQAVASLSGVLATTGSSDQIARTWDRPVLSVEGEKMEAIRFEVGRGYLAEYVLRPIAGRLFDDRPVPTAGAEVVINERFARSRGWEPDDAVGRTFRLDTLSVSVIGVVADFNYNGFYEPVEPTYFREVPESAYRYLTLSVAPGAAVRTAETVESTWKQLFPDLPYAGLFQDAVFDQEVRQNMNIKRLFSFIAILALVIACMGLFGLTVQKVVRSRREIGIRKVLGASTPQITKVVNRGFVALVAAAAVIAAPLGYAGMKVLLASVYSDPLPVGPWPFVLSTALVLAAAVGTVATQVRRIAHTNPAEVLRSE